VGEPSAEWFVSSGHWSVETTASWSDQPGSTGRLASWVATSEDLVTAAVGVARPVEDQ
jgi:hypothetical protein